MFQLHSARASTWVRSVAVVAVAAVMLSSGTGALAEEVDSPGDSQVAILSAETPTSDPATPEDPATPVEPAYTEPSEPTETGDPAASEEPASESPELVEQGDTPQDPEPSLRSVAPADQEVLGEPEISPLANPGTAEIVINAAVLRSSTSYLVGLQYVLYTVTGSGTTGDPYQSGVNTGLSCSITSGSSCTITVPSDYLDDRLFVVQIPNSSTYDFTGAAADTYQLGDARGPNQVGYLIGATPLLRSGENYSIPSDLVQTSGVFSRASTVVAPLINPLINLQCEATLTLAIQMDLSASVQTRQRAQYGAALKEIIDGLDASDAPVKIALFTFGTQSPVNGNSNLEFTTPRDVNNAAEKAALKSAIDSLTGAKVGTNYTNWDAAMRRVSTASTHFDMLLFLTDGAPNVIGTSGTQVNGTNVTIKSIDEATLSANALKSAGTRIVAVGIGEGASGAVRTNLAMISGPTSGADYFQTSWDNLQTYIKSIVNSAVCRAPITVTKEILTSDGTWTTASNWEMLLNLGDASVASIAEGANPQQTTSTGAQWAVQFASRSVPVAITVTETQQSGWVSLGGTYTVTHPSGTPTSGTFTGTSTEFSVQADDSAQVTFRNAPLGTFSVTKDVTGTADANRTYQGTWECTLDTKTVASGTWGPITDGQTWTADADDAVPAGSLCAVTGEADPGGPVSEDPSYVWGTTSWSSAVSAVALASSSIPKITVTNPVDRPNVPLTIAKVVADGSVYTGTGTAFTIDYTCGTGEDAVTGSVELAAGGSETVTVPPNTLCTVTEKTSLPVLPEGYQWAAASYTVATPTSSEPEDGNTVTVPAGAAAGDYVVTALNSTEGVYGTFGIAKNFENNTSATGIASFTGTWECVYGADTDLETTLTGTWRSGAGAPSTGTHTAQLKVDGTTTWVDKVEVLLGSRCSVTETAPVIPYADPSYTWLVSAPDTLVGTVNSNTPDLVITVANALNRTSATFSITKQVEGNEDQYVSAEPFEFSVSCQPVTASEAPVTGTLEVVAGQTKQFLEASIPAASTCTVWETDTATPVDPYRWDGVTYTGEQGLVVTEVSVDGIPGAQFTLPAGAVSVDLTATNAMRMAYGSVTATKNVVDPESGYDGTAVFALSLYCGPNSQELTQFGSSVTVSGKSGQNVATWDEIPVGQVCEVRETITPAQAGLTDPSYSWAAAVIAPSGGVTITEGDAKAVTVTNTATRSYGVFAVTKAVEGVADESVTFSGSWECSIGSDAVASGTWGPIAAGETWTSAADAGIPLGAECAVTAENPADGPVVGDTSWTWTDTSLGEGVAAAALETDEVPTIEVVNTSMRSYGSFQVTKKVAGFADADLTYSGSYRCVIGDSEAATGTWGPIAAGETWTSAADIPLGATCTVVEETAPDGPVADDSSYVWDGAADLGGGVQAAGEDADPAVITVTNTSTRLTGSFSITKRVEGTADSGATFTGTWRCEYGKETFAGTWGPIAAGETWTSDSELGIPMGASCFVTSESMPDAPVVGSATWAWNEPSLGEEVEISTEGVAAIEVVNSSTMQYGVVTVTKVIAPDTDRSGIPEDAQFGFTWQCVTPEEETIPAEAAGSFELAEGQTWETEVPLGSTCWIEESEFPDTTGPSFTWRGVLTAGSEVSGSARVEFTVPASAQETPFAVIATNTLQVDKAASWTLAKTSDPVSGSKVAAGSYIVYTLTATNTGDVPVVGATATDDAAKVFAHAVLAAPLPDGLTRSGNTLTWEIPDVPVGGTASVSYQVRVDSDASDVTLTNVVVPGDGGTCTVCTTTHDVPPAEKLPPTGADAAGTAGAAVLLALTGLGVLAVGRRAGRRLV